MNSTIWFINCKFVRAFKSPNRKGKGKEKDSTVAVAQPEKDIVDAGIALRSWQEGPVGTEQNSDDEHDQPMEQSLLMDSVDVDGDSTSVIKGKGKDGRRSSSLSFYQPCFSFWLAAYQRLAFASQ